jgi:hypothetical protein
MQTPFNYGTFPVLLLWPFEKAQLDRVKQDDGVYTEELQKHDCHDNYEIVGGPFGCNDSYGNPDDYYVHECLVCGDLAYF